MTKVWKHRLSYQGRTVDALALEADEDVTNDDMLWVAVSKFDPEISEWGTQHELCRMLSTSEFIACQKAHPEN